jgi:type IV pilus assembly protein PilM
MFSIFSGKSVIGLDIGTASIKIAEVSVSGRTAKLVAFGMIPTPSSGIIGGDIAEPQALGLAVRNLVSKARIRKTQTCAGLWGSSVIVKKISVPKMDAALVAEQIRWEAEQYIPYDINDVNIDFHVLKTISSNSETMDVLLVAARHEQVFKFVEVIDSAGLQTAILDINGFALGNCFLRNYSSSRGQATAILNIGANYTNFVVVEGSEVIFCRDIPVGGAMYTTDIQKAMGISAPEAEALKLSAAAGGAVPEEVAASMASTHEAVVDEIQGSFDFFANTTPTSSISRVLVSGGGSRTPGLVQHLSSTVSAPCEAFDPFARIKYDRRAFSDTYISEIREFSAVVLGLGLRRVGDR